MKTTLTPTAAALRSRQGGFSVVELLVSVGVGLLALSFATRLVGQSEQHKQTTLGGSGTMQNGVLAMFSISGDASQAGWGINDPIVSGCDAKFTDHQGFELAKTTVGGSERYPLAPVIIESNGELPDKISFYSGGAMSGTGGAVLTDSVSSGATNLKVSSVSYGFSRGDVIVVASDSIGQNPCTVAQISNDPAIPVAPGDKPFIDITAGSNFRYNSSGLTQSYVGGKARIFNLGPVSQMAFRTWSIDKGFLKMRATNLEGAITDPATVVDNIVSIKAQYGFDTRPAPSVTAVPGTFSPEAGLRITQWSSTMIDADGNGNVGSPIDYQRVVAIRLAVVARGRAPERAAPNEACTATPTQPVVFANKTDPNVDAAPVTVNVDVADDPIDWQCYRYRVFETVVPIRNNAWRPDAL